MHHWVQQALHCQKTPHRHGQKSPHLQFDSYLKILLQNSVFMFQVLGSMTLSLLHKGCAPPRTWARSFTRIMTSSSTKSQAVLFYHFLSFSKPGIFKATIIFNLIVVMCFWRCSSWSSTARLLGAKCDSPTRLRKIHWETTIPGNSSLNWRHMCALDHPPDEGPTIIIISNPEAMEFFAPIHLVIIPNELLAGFRAKGDQGIDHQDQGLVGRGVLYHQVL